MLISTYVCEERERERDLKCRAWPSIRALFGFRLAPTNGVLRLLSLTSVLVKMAPAPRTMTNMNERVDCVFHSSTTRRSFPISSRSLPPFFPVMHVSRLLGKRSYIYIYIYVSTKLFQPDLSTCVSCKYQSIK
jgi:hypothetical protein